MTGKLKGHLDANVEGLLSGKKEWSDVDVNDTISKFSSQITNQINSQVTTSVETQVQSITASQQSESHETGNKVTSSTETIGVKYVVSDKPTITVEEG